LRKRGRPQSLADLAQHDCVLFRGKNGKAEWHMTGPVGEVTVVVRGPINADEMAFVQRAVSAGAGIALLPKGAVRLAAASGKLPKPVQLFPEYSVAGADLNVVTPSVRFLSASVTAFRDFLSTELSALWNSA
jgi:DNA-binding transcriptional LysR family regulator